MKISHIKALIWRDWRISGKNFIRVMSIGFSLCAIFWLIRASMSYGNLHVIFDTDAFIAGFSGILYYTSTSTAAVTMIGYALADNTTLSADLNSNWMRYSFVLPIMPQDRAAASVIIKAYKLLAGLAFTVLNGFITAKITGVPFTGHMMLFFLCIAVGAMIYDLYASLFCLRARSAAQFQKRQMISSGIMMIPVFGYLIKKMSEETDESFVTMDDGIERVRNIFISHENILIPAVIIGFLVLPVLIFFVNVWLMRTHGDVQEAEKPEKKRLFGKKQAKKGADAS